MKGAGASKINHGGRGGGGGHGVVVVAVVVGGGEGGSGDDGGGAQKYAYANAINDFWYVFHSRTETDKMT